MKCAQKHCNRSWHYPCGTRNACMTTFSGQFESFCNEHVLDPNGGIKHDFVYCLVCYKLLPAYNHADSIISSCCLLLPDWYKCFSHKKCVMEYTKNAGYDSTCINCTMGNEGMTKEKWQNEMRQKGIFIPKCEASWESEGYFDN